MLYVTHIELTDHARKAKTREDIVDVEVMSVEGSIGFWLAAKIDGGDETRAWITPLDDDVPSSKGFLDNLAGSGQL